MVSIYRWRRQGENRKQEEIAKKLLSKKMNVEEVAEVTGLTIEEVRKLI